MCLNTPNLTMNEIIYNVSIVQRHSLKISLMALLDEWSKVCAKNQNVSIKVEQCSFFKHRCVDVIKRYTDIIWIVLYHAGNWNL